MFSTPPPSPPPFLLNLSPPPPPSSPPFLHPSPFPQAAIDSCPVRCIHTVRRSDLPALEFLMHPHQRHTGGGHTSVSVFGQGWGKKEGSLDIFRAAQVFRTKVKRQQEEAARKSAGERGGGRDR